MSPEVCSSIPIEVSGNPSRATLRLVVAPQGRSHGDADTPRETRERIRRMTIAVFLVLVLEVLRPRSDRLAVLGERAQWHGTRRGVRPVPSCHVCGASGYDESTAFA